VPARKGAVAAALALLGAALLAAASAAAAPTELTVRIEGKERTLFEGPILTDGHNIQSASDKESRRCDGTNNGAHAAPGPTPTTAAVDAIGLVGQTFGAKWFPGFDDYFVERWGPDAEDLNAAKFWGVLVNGVLISVGGCQYTDAPKDEVLWAYDAFSGRELLRLAAASDPSSAPTPPAPTAHVEVGASLDLEVQSFTGAEGQAPSVNPAVGVAVAPVLTEAGTGFQMVQTGSPATVITDAAGLASVSFADPGWHRLKAQNEAGFIRSNRLNVCVEPVGGGSCGPLPADAQVRVPPRPQPPVQGGGPAGTMSLGRLVLHRRTGTATILVSVPGPGQVTLSGAAVSVAGTEVRAAGPVRLTIRARASRRAQLRRRGQLRVRLQVTFAPTSGAATSLRRGLTLRFGLPR
jgi:hypothetical protein